MNMTLQPGQPDRGLIGVVFITVVWDEQQVFMGDPYRHEHIVQGPNQTENFQRIPFKGDDLKSPYVSSCVCTESSLLFLYLNLAYSRDNPTGVIYQKFDMRQL
jgi:hypothetical protein